MGILVFSTYFYVFGSLLHAFGKKFTQLHISAPHYEHYCCEMAVTFLEYLRVVGL